MSETSESFDEMANLLSAAGADCSASEMHGFLCGHLCTGERTHVSWLQHAHGLLDVGALSDEIKSALILLFEVNEACIQEANFDFQLLLPDDDDDMELRVAAMGQFCQGFLTSFGMGCSDERAQALSEDTQSALGDFVAIAQVQHDDVIDDDAAEVDYTEVMEYVRLAVLSIAMECREKTPAQSNTNLLH